MMINHIATMLKNRGLKLIMYFEKNRKATYGIRYYKSGFIKTSIMGDEFAAKPIPFEQ